LHGTCKSFGVFVPDKQDYAYVHSEQRSGPESIVTFLHFVLVFDVSTPTVITGRSCHWCKHWYIHSGSELHWE